MRCAAFFAFSTLSPASNTSSFIFAPPIDLMPPAALMLSIARLAPFSIRSPCRAQGPDIGAISATFTSVCACAAPALPSASDSASSVLRFSKRPSCRSCYAFSVLLADLDAGPLLDRFHEFGDVGVRPHRGLADPHHLPHRIADDHRHAERFRLVETELDVLVEQRGGEAEVEAARHHAARKLVGGRCV